MPCQARLLVSTSGGLSSSLPSGTGWACLCSESRVSAPCLPAVTNDIMGDHAVSCAIGGERISKHNHVRDAIFKAAVEAGLGPVREPDGLLPGSDDRPADVLIPIWTEGRDTALDITVVNPLQQALVARASEEGDSAVEHAHKAKLRKYEEGVPK